MKKKRRSYHNNASVRSRLRTAEPDWVTPEKLESVPGIPPEIQERLVDPQDRWHLTEEGGQWLRRISIALELLGPPQSKPSIGV